MKNRTDYTKKYDDLTYESEPKIQEEVIIDSEPESTKSKFVKVSVARLNLRPNPSIDDDPIKELSKNDELMVIDEEDVWYYVMTASGSEGYVMKDYVE